jgi:small multidrug resistance family-3 protein
VVPAVLLILKALVLFVLTAVAEIVGCYLPYLWLREKRSAWLLIPAAVSLALFSWLLTLHPTGAARTYAAYGGVYISVALLWLWAVEQQRPSRWDFIGVAICLIGMAVIIAAPRPARHLSSPAQAGKNDRHGVFPHSD